MMLAGVAVWALACQGPEVEDSTASRGTIRELLELVRTHETAEPSAGAATSGSLLEGEAHRSTSAEQETQQDPPAVGDDTQAPATQAAPAMEGEGPAVEPPPLVTPEGDPFDDNPYVVFGERIRVHPGGHVTKPFPLPQGKGRRILDLLQLYADFTVNYTIREPNAKPSPPPTEKPGPGEVQVVLLESWDVEPYLDLRKWPPSAAVDFVIADWMVVTARPELLLEVEDFIDLFAASVPQIEIEAKIVEIFETDAFDYGVRGVDGLPIFDFPEGTLVDSLDYVFANSTDANEALLQLGTIHDETAFNAILEVVKRWENVEISSMPRIAVREGGRAEIVNTQEIPFFAFSGINATGSFQAQLQFKEVGVQLYVVPRVMGTDTIALNIDLEASQQAGTLVSFSTQGGGDLSTPIISKRTARTIVHLKPGEAIIIGGLTTSRNVEAEEKIPFLGDIPLLGLLFKSKSLRTEKSSVLFFIRPRMLEGIDLHREF